MNVQQNVTNDVELNSSSQDAFAWTAHDIIKGTTLSIMTVVVIISNIICLFALRNTQMGPSTKVLMYSLNAADLCVGLFQILPTSISSFINTWIFGETACFIAVIIGGAPYYNSNWTLLAMAVERYIAVTNPLKYRAIFTKSRAVIAVIFIWILSLCYEILVCGLNKFQVYFHQPTDQCWSIGGAGSDSLIKVSVIFLIFGPFIVFAVLYLRMFFVIRQQNRRRQQMTKQNLDANRKQQSTQRADIKMAQTFMIITCAFFVATCPVTTVYIVENITGKANNEWVYFIVTTTSFCNSWFNTVIYFLRNASFRNSVLRLFKPATFKRSARTRREAAYVNTVCGSASEH